jgi:hypothetical protein
VISINTALVASLAAAALAAPACAAADPTFNAFATVCGDTGANFAAVSSAADANGWRRADVVAESSMPGVAIADRLSRELKAGDTPLTLSAWRGTTKSGVQVSACTVRVAKPDYAGLHDAAQAWIGFAPQDDAATKAIFRFTDTASAHKALVSGEYDAAAAAAGMEILTVSGDNHGSVVDLLKIKK